MTNRRDFLRSLLAAGALAGARGGEALAAKPKPRGRSAGHGPASPPSSEMRQIPLALLLDPETAAGRGARLGLEEAQRAGELLHLQFQEVPTSEYAIVGLVGPKQEPAALFLTVGPLLKEGETPRPRVYSVSASLEFRRQALSRHPDRNDLHVVDWHHDLRKFGADALNLRFSRRFEQPMDEAAWRGWMAVKLITELALRYPQTVADASATDKLEELSIDGHKGMPLRFDPRNHHLIQPVYLVDAGEKVVEEVAPEWTE
jgi:hypothetical protein